jgi:rSAM/selenodomain-associated transferase 1
MIETLSEIPQTVSVCYSPDYAGPHFRKWLGDKYLYFSQQGDNLGERMKHSFQQAFRHGFEKVVIIGSDSPDLPAHIIIKAFENLDAFDTVIGPAVDGGYYLLGIRHDTFCPEIFEDIPWSTDIVFDQTLKKIEQAALTFSILPEWYDVDNLSELQQLYNRYQHTSQNKRRKLTNTISYLHTMEGDWIQDGILYV